jgi:similar to spore coat protein
MANLIQNLAGMGDMTEQVVASDFLISAKAGVRNYAMAISETVTPGVRDMLVRHLNEAIGMHEKVAAYMMKKGYYRVHDPKEQIELDVKAADTVLDIWQRS